MASIAIDTAVLLALIFETVLFGIFLSLYTVMVIVLRPRAGTGSTGSPTHRRVLIPVCTVMILSASVHLIINCVRIIDGFTQSHTVSAVAYFNENSDPLFLASLGIYVLQTLTGDGFLVWRFYVVFGRNKRSLIVPLVIIAVSIGTGLFAGYLIVLRKGASLQTLETVLAVNLGMTMLNSIICTNGIAWKVYVSGRTARKAGSGHVWPVVLTVLESGALYSLVVGAFLILFLVDDKGYRCALDSLTPLIGITVCFMVLQIQYHQHISSTERSNGNKEAGTFVMLPRPACHTESRQNGVGRLTQVESIEVHVTRQTESV